MTSAAFSTLSSPCGLAIIAPSGYAPEGANIERGLAMLAQQGFTVHNYYQHEERYLRFGGTDQARLAQLHDAARDPAVKVVMALRGSYGISRLLPLIDYDLLASSGKVFVGYSDFTALNLALLAKTGTSSYSGPMLMDDYTNESPNAFTLTQFLTCLRGPTHSISVMSAQQEAQEGSVASGDTRSDLLVGTLWGGNLAMIGHLIGTAYMPQLDDGILFIEDIAEHPYRVERLLLQLLYAGILAKQRAIILGDFSAYRLSPYDNGFDFAQMLAFIRRQVDVPIFTDLPYGHIRERACLPIGARVHLAANAAGYSLTMSDYVHI